MATALLSCPSNEQGDQHETKTLDGLACWRGHCARRTCICRRSPHRLHRAEDRHFRAARHRHAERPSDEAGRAQGELGGAKVTLIVEDDQGKPDTGVTKANKLILSDKVHMLVGGVLATTGSALAPVAPREKMLYIGSIATADDLGQRDFEKYPYMVRPTFVPSQPSHPLGQWACEQG